MRALQLVVSRVGCIVRFGGRGRIAIAVLSTLIAAGALAACGTSDDQRNGMDEIRSSGVLRVGTEGTYAPFSYRDPTTGELAGYDVDVANAVADKLGVRTEFVTTPWDSIFAGLEAGRFDVVANQVSVTPERKAKYDLSKPYAISEGVIVTRADDNSIRSLDDLRGKTTAQSATSNWAQVARDAGERRVRRGIHPGDQAAQSGPRPGDGQRQRRRLRLLRRDRRYECQDRRQDRGHERAGIRGQERQRHHRRHQQGARRAQR